MAERRYDDQEVSQILSKASEMQSGLTDVAAPTGVTLSDLKRVAEEVGISADNVEMAAQALDSVRTTKASNESDSVFLSQSVPGELTDEAWDDIVTEMRRYAGCPGHSSVSGTAREWVSEYAGGSISLSTTSRNGRTTLKLLANSSGGTAIAISTGFALGLLLTLVPLIVASKAATPSAPMVTFLLSALIAVLSVLTIRSTIAWNRRKCRVRTEALLDGLVKVAESHRDATVESNSHRDALGSDTNENRPQNEHGLVERMR